MSEPLPASELTLARAYEVLGLEPLDEHFVTAMDDPSISGIGRGAGMGATTWMSIYVTLGVMRGAAVMVVIDTMPRARSRDSYLQGIIERLGDTTQPRVRKLHRPKQERERNFTSYSSGGRLFVRSERTYRSALQGSGMPKGIILFKDVDWKRKALERLGDPDVRARYFVPQADNPRTGTKVYQVRDETWCPVMLVNQDAAREMLSEDPKRGITEHVPTALVPFASNW